jgi:hypothetical protein
MKESMNKTALVLLGALLTSLLLVAPTPAQAATKTVSDAYATATGTADNIAVKADACGDYGRLIANVVAAPGWTLDRSLSYWSADIYSPSGDWNFAYGDLGNTDKVFLCGSPNEFGTYRVDFEVSYWVDSGDDYQANTLQFSTTFVVSRAKATSTVYKTGTVAKAANRSWKIAGKLSRTGDSTFSGQIVKLQRYAGGAWSTYRSCVTGSTGVCSVVAPTTSRTTYRWYYAGNSAANADASGSFILAARQVPYTTSVVKYGPATKAANRSWKVVGKLSRNGDSTYQGQTIKLQKRSSGGWVTVKSCTTMSTGRCAVTARTTARTTYRWYFAGHVDARVDASTAWTLARR